MVNKDFKNWLEEMIQTTIKLDMPIEGGIYQRVLNHYKQLEDFKQKTQDDELDCPDYPIPEFTSIKQKQ